MIITTWIDLTGLADSGSFIQSFSHSIMSTWEWERLADCNPFSNEAEADDNLSADCSCWTTAYIFINQIVAQSYFSICSNDFGQSVACAWNRQIEIEMYYVIAARLSHCKASLLITVYITFLDLAKRLHPSVGSNFLQQLPRCWNLGFCDTQFS